MGNNTNEEKIVYLVTKGNYSDSHVIGVYDDKALATECGRLFSDDWDTCDILTYVLNSAHDFGQAPGHSCYAVFLKRDSDDIDFEMSSPRLASTQLEPTGYDKDTAFVTIWAKNVQTAIKIALDMKRVTLAEGRWPTHPLFGK